MVGGASPPAYPDIDVPFAIVLALMHLNVSDGASKGALRSQLALQDQFKFHFHPIVISIIFTGVVEAFRLAIG